MEKYDRKNLSTVLSSYNKMKNFMVLYKCCILHKGSTQYKNDGILRRQTLKICNQFCTSRQNSEIRSGGKSV